MRALFNYVAAEFPKTPSPKPARRRGLGRNADGFPNSPKFFANGFHAS